MSFISVLAVVFLAGVCTASPGSRIVNGIPTTIESYPSIVQLDFFNPNTNTWAQKCDGTILNQVFILSAAQCTDARSDPFFSVQNRRVRAGATYRNTGGVITSVAGVVNHPEYNQVTFFDANICIIRLGSLLSFGNTINSIPIIVSDFEIPNNAPVSQAGWGATRDDADEESSDVLMFVNLVHKSNCDGVPEILLTDNKICTGSVNNQPGGACGGDYGGPVYYGGVLAGVVSWGPGGCESQLPTLSMKVSAFTNWILENTLSI